MLYNIIEAPAIYTELISLVDAWDNFYGHPQHGQAQLIHHFLMTLPCRGSSERNQNPTRLATLHLLHPLEASRDIPVLLVVQSGVGKI